MSNKYKMSVFLMVLMISVLLPGIAGLHQSVTTAHAASNVNIGDYIQFGKYNNASILWRVIHKDGNGDPVLLADRILTLKAFDAKGSYHTGNTSRVNYGSNYYPDSNIRQWLNSSSPNSGTSTIDWIQNDPTATNMLNSNNPYNTERGFLADGNFTSVERSLIKPLTHKVLLAGVDQSKKNGGTANHTNNTTLSSVVQNYDTTAYFRNVTDNVFLLSVKQLKEWVYDNRATLGTGYHIAKPTAQAVAQSTYKLTELSSTQNWLYWLNSPSAAQSYYVRRVGSDGVIGESSGYIGTRGVRPALLLNLSSVIFTSSGTGTSSNPYTVGNSLISAPTNINLSSTSFAENNIVNSTIGTLSAIDANAGDTFVYSLIAGAGDVDNASFNISGNTLRTSRTFDFEAKTPATYSIRVRVTDNSGLSFDKTFQITVSDVNEIDLQIGQYVQYGKYNNQPILWRVIHLDEQRNPLLLSDRILTIKAFDAKGSYHSGNSDRMNYGSNYYPDSNIRQWLNNAQSNVGADRIDWWQNDPVAANLWGINYGGPNLYSNEKGFLADGNFSAAEREMMKPYTHKIVISPIDLSKRDGGTVNHQYNTNISTAVQNYDNAHYKNVTDKVFLLSVKQLKEFVADRGFPVTAIPTPQAAANNVYSYISSTNTWYYFLNTANAASNTAHDIRYVFPSGSIETVASYIDNGGVRPALQLSNSNLKWVSGAGTSSNPHIYTSRLAPTDLSLSANSIAENMPGNSTIGTLSAVDLDAGDTFTYSLVAGAGDTDNNVFNISGNSLRTNRKLNFEAKSIYSVRVRVQDSFGFTFEKVFAINVTNTNDVPVISGPSALSMSPGVDGTLSGITLMDPDSNQVVVKIDAGSGMLSVSATAGVTTIGLNTGSLQLVGAPNAVNTSLTTLRYRGYTGFNGTDTLTITANDGSGEQAYRVIENGKYFAPFNGRVYEYVNVSNTTWSEAKNGALNLRAYNLKGYLASITTQEEMDFITEIVGTNWAWIGLTDQAEEGVFRWSDGPEEGQTVNYSHWGAGEPNNLGDEDFVHLYNDGTGRWNDVPSTGIIKKMEGYLVEYGGPGFGGTFTNGNKLLINLNDTTAPTVPTSFAASNVQTSSLTLNWTPSTDNVGVTAYEVYRDGALVARVSGTSYTFTGLTDNTTYSFSVKAIDAAGNISVASQSVTFKSLDGTAPSVPTGLFTTNLRGNEVTVNWMSSTDNMAVTGYDMFLNGSKIAAVGSNSYTLTNLTDGQAYSVSVQAFDAAGNRSGRSALLIFQLPDITPPSEPGNLTLVARDEKSLTFSWGDSSDNVGIAGYIIYLNGNQIIELSRSGTGNSMSNTYKINGLQPYTNYRVQVSAYDRAGNPSVISPNKTFRTADLTAPSIPAGLKITQQAPLTALRLTWSPSADNVAIAGYNVFLNNKLLTTRTVSQLGNTAALTRLDLTNLPYGSHKLQVQAFDAAGNKSKLSTVINTPRTILITGGKLYINGKLINLGSGFAPTAIGGQTMVPYKSFFTALGFTTKWFTGNSMLEAYSLDKKYFIKLTQGVKSLQVKTNTRTLFVTLPAAPTIRSGQLMVPIRPIATELGYTFTVR